MKMENLLGYNLSELIEISLQNSMKRYTGAQIAQWIYPQRCESIEQMTNISLKDRERLAEKYVVSRNKAENIQDSKDGTRKYLFHTPSGNPIESVYIPSSDRATLCISSQAGCRMGCEFCMTGKIGLKENLTAGEIINQFISIEEYERLTNVVYMGMGEPMDNIDNVLRSIEILTSSWGFGWSPTRITVSTIGILEPLKRLMEESKVHLAISLHSPFDGEREELIPMQRANPIREILSLLKEYNWWGQRRLSFEYIMFDGLNDTERHLGELVNLLRGINCRVNLIRFHQIPDSPLRGSSSEHIKWFNRELNHAGISTTTRSSRGEDIFAACGMLAAKV